MTTHSVVALAAGKGTRMNSQTPKVLHRICGKEMLRLVVESAKSANLHSIVVVVPEDSQAFRQTLGDTANYAIQSQQLGTGHALLQARTALQGADNVVVLAGDVPLVSSETIENLVRVHNQREATITLLTTTLPTPDGLGRIVRSDSGDIAAIVEESEADSVVLEITEINGGIYCFRSSWLWRNLENLAPSSQGEIFLTDLIALAVEQGMPVESVQVADPDEIMGVNNRVELARAESVLRQSLREKWMLAGVTMPDPSSVYIDATAELGQDTVVLPNSHVTGRTRVGRNCEIGPNSIVSGSVIGNECKIVASVVENSELKDGVVVGPFSHVRPGSYLERGVHIGNYAEVKNSRLGPGTKMGHFSYIGDADVGANVNVGAGAITCNYDGERKNHTTIGDDVFIGSDTMLIAPIKVGARSITGAGSVVNKDIPPDSSAIGAPARVMSNNKSQKKTGGSQ